jgi:hypothetical protein
MRSVLTALLTASVLAGCAAEVDGDVVGPRGGILVSDDGQLTVEIRENALQDEMALSVVATPCDDPTLQACYAFEPWGVMLAAPAWIVFEPQSQLMPVDHVKLKVEGEQGYVPMSDANCDPEQGKAWATVMYLTSVAVTLDG